VPKPLPKATGLDLLIKNYKNLSLTEPLNQVAYEKLLKPTITKNQRIIRSRFEARVIFFIPLKKV